MNATRVGPEDAQLCLRAVTAARPQGLGNGDVNLITILTAFAVFNPAFLPCPVDSSF